MKVTTAKISSIIKDSRVKENDWFVYMTDGKNAALFFTDGIAQPTRESLVIVQDKQREILAGDDLEREEIKNFIDGCLKCSVCYENSPESFLIF